MSSLTELFLALWSETTKLKLRPGSLNASSRVSSVHCAAGIPFTCSIKSDDRNPVSAAGVQDSFPQLNDEFVVKQDPDYILLSGYNSYSPNFVDNFMQKAKYIKSQQKTSSDCVVFLTCTNVDRSLWALF